MPPPSIPPPLPPQAPEPPLRGDGLPPVINAAPPAIPPALPAEALVARFRGDLSPELAAVEKLRRAVLVSEMLGVLWVLVFVGSIGVLAGVFQRVDLAQMDPQLRLVLMGGVALLVIVYFGLGICLYRRTAGRLANFRCAYKQAVLPHAVRLISPSFEYLPDGIPFQRFFEGRLFLQRPDNYHAEDRFRGQVGATAFEFSEVTATYTTKDLNGHTVDAIIFRGIYFIADFNKHFRTRTLVVPDTGEKKQGFLGRAFQNRDSSRGRLITLEDPEFENEFDVFADDEVEARYILTPALMARILSLKRSRGPVSLSFLNDQVHVALSVARDLFEPSVFEQASDSRQIAGFLNDIRSILGIIEILNLNTRIWSKR